MAWNSFSIFPWFNYHKKEYYLTIIFGYLSFIFIFNLFGNIYGFFFLFPQDSNSRTPSYVPNQLCNSQWGIPLYSMQTNRLLVFFKFLFFVFHFSPILLWPVILCFLFSIYLLHAVTWIWHSKIPDTCFPLMRKDSWSSELYFPRNLPWSTFQNLNFFGMIDSLPFLHCGLSSSSY